MRNRIYKYLILLNTFFILASCHSGYEEKEGKIYLKWIHGGDFTKEWTLIKDADAKSFETIDHNVKLKLGKDKNHVFYRARKIKDADPKTFVQVAYYFWKDENNVYNFNHGLQNYIVKFADPENFEVLDINVWGKDKNSIFHKSSKSQVIDIESFTPINENWGKDNQYYYWQTKKLDSLDYESAEIVKTYFRDKKGKYSYYIKDKNNVYFKNQIVNGVNPKSFVANGVGSFGNDGVNRFSWEENKGPITDKFKQTYYIKE
ncbi:DKNYY domain-containing protein [Tamlana sp. 2201CG12-4]|uniref:DKNYY domain-containing protein n=1 Tax=Tamlana sp. 2201CG12-4 TaxID=3112582 RepID=UPI002DBDD895|nr:DKNYY domain-containing protein [Tamlana sp. 2201CG12-4]MEC3907843.1 DKNYY domain-containing protein [Tamlana sp. 2201CG12-4]